MSKKNTGAGHRGELGLLLALLILIVLYLIDTYRASQALVNLIFVVPVSLIVGLLVLQQIFAQTKKMRDPDYVVPERDSPREIFPVMGLFGAYVLSIHWIGFDLGTVFFLAAFLWMQGERRWPWLVSFPLLFGLGVAIFFDKMLPYSMKLVVLSHFI